MKLLLGIDVEDWFQVENLKEVIKIDSWSSRESRIEKNIELILTLLSTGNNKATFFIVGWIAEKFPLLVKKIQKEGHEIACHGYNHFSSGELNDEELYSDIKKSKDILEDITGDRIQGFRAPNFSISDKLVKILTELRFSYDSSLCNANILRQYGKLENFEFGNAHCFKLTENFFELQLPTLNLLKYSIPWAGGAMFRFIPYWIFKIGIDRIILNNSFYNFYIHPWELDPLQPRINEINYKKRLKHYHNLDSTERKFIQLLKDFNFLPLKEYLADVK